MPRDRKQYARDNKAIQSRRTVKYDKTGKIIHNTEETRALDPRKNINSENINDIITNRRNIARNNKKRIDSEQIKRRDVSKELETLYNQRDLIKRASEKNDLTEKQKSMLHNVESKITRFEKEQGKNIVARQNHSKEEIKKLKEKQKNGILTKKEEKQLKKEEKNQRIFERQKKYSKVKETGLKAWNIRNAPANKWNEIQDKALAKKNQKKIKSKDKFHKTGFYQGYNKNIKKPISNRYKAIKSYPKKTLTKMGNKIKQTTIGKSVQAKYQKAQGKLLGKTKTRLNSFKGKMAKTALNNPRAITRMMAKLAGNIAKFFSFIVSAILPILCIIASIFFIIFLWFVITVLINFFNTAQVNYSFAKVEGVQDKVQAMIDKQDYGNKETEEREINYDAKEITAVLLTLTDTEWLYEEEESKTSNSVTKSQMINTGYRYYDEETIQKVIDLFTWDDDEHYNEYNLYKYNEYSDWSAGYDSEDELIEGYKNSTGQDLVTGDENTMKSEMVTVLKKGDKDYDACKKININGTMPEIYFTGNESTIGFTISDYDSGISNIVVKKGGFFYKETLTNISFKSYNEDYEPYRTSYNNSYEADGRNFYITVRNNAGSSLTYTATYNSDSEEYELDDTNSKKSNSETYEKKLIEKCNVNPPLAKEDVIKEQWYGRTLMNSFWDKDANKANDKIVKISTKLIKEYNLPSGEDVINRILYKYTAKYNGIEKEYSPLNPYENEGDCHEAIDSTNKGIYRGCDGRIYHSWESENHQGIEFLEGKDCGFGSTIGNWFNYETNCQKNYNPFIESDDIYSDYWVKYANLAESFLGKNEHINVYPKDFGKIYWNKDNKKEIMTKYTGYEDLVTGVINASLENDTELISGKGDWIFPLKTVTVTSESEERSDAGKVNEMHYGMDMSGDIGFGSTVYAVIDGSVTQASFTCPVYSDLGSSCPLDVASGKFSGGGNFIQIKTEYKGKTYYTNYMHLSKVNVKIGDKIKKGQKIGEQGDSGNSSGPHLHLEIHENTDSVGNGNGYINPRKLIEGLPAYGQTGNMPDFKVVESNKEED